VNKESLREELDEADAWFKDIKAEPDIIHAAARRYERLIPGACIECEAALGHEPWQHNTPGNCAHDDCHGTGKVWAEGLVEAVAETVYDSQWGQGMWAADSPAGTPAEVVENVARAILAALFNELEAE
jgi:hypothetical protein